ncbi:MAG: toll/interleukin-1 receptor domain-containing protein [Hyphomicrobiales bacterium]
MATASGLTILAQAADARLGALLEERLVPLVQRAAPTPGAAILLATSGLAEGAEEGLVGSALDAWSRGQLLVVAVDGATPPLGLRDVERVAWTPSAGDAGQLADIAARLARQSAEPRLAEQGRADGPSAPVPATVAVRRARRSRRTLLGAIAAALLLCAGIAGLVLTRRSAMAPSGAPEIAGRFAAREYRVGPAPGAPGLDTPSGAGPGAGFLEKWGGLGLWIIPALLSLGLGAYLVIHLRRRRKAAARPARAAQTANMKRPAPDAAATTAAEGGKPIFVSYSHQDIARVDPIVDEIEALGHAVWIDRREISGGPGWAGQVVRGLRAARTVVLMASRQAYASDQVVREMYLAMSEKKPIVPFELESAEMPDELQYILAPFQRHRLDGGDRSKIIVNALAAL